MKPLKLLRTIAVLIGFIPILFGLAPHARAGLPQTLAEQAKLKAKIAGLQKNVSSQRRRAEDLTREYGDADLNVRLAEIVLNDYRKELAKAEKTLRSVQGKIARQRSEVAKDAAKDAAKTMAQNASRDAAMAAAKEAAKTGAKEAAKSASKTASKDSSKDSSHGAAKSAAHPPPPAMHHVK